jgi:hypothetical protein
MCTYCGAPGTEAELEVDHIIAVANGGSHHISNLTTACRRCNQEKGTKSVKPHVLQSQAPKPTSDNPLVGMYLHTFVDGHIQYQAKIIGVDGELVFAQMFSWMFGEKTDVRSFSKSFVLSESCRLYADAATWRFRANEGQIQKWNQAV